MNDETDAAHRRLADIRRRIAVLRREQARMDRLTQSINDAIEQKSVEPVRRELR